MSWFVQDTPLVKKYKKVRKLGHRLNDRARDDCLKTEVIGEATRLLGMRQGKAIIFEEESDIAPLMDFALYDCRWQGKSAVEQYQEEVGGETAAEQELLAAMVASYTSLFRVESIRQVEKTLYLTDLLAEEPTPLKMIDVGLSETAVPGLLLFHRLMSLPDFSMSTGAGFIFPTQMESRLLRQYEVILRNVKAASRVASVSLRPGATRFIAFFKLNQRFGLSREYQ